MGFLEQVYGEAVFIDTAPFIYFVEDKAPYAELLVPFYEALDNGDFRAFTSTLSYAESLVVPLRTQNKNDITKYEWLFSTQTPGLFIVPFELATAKKTAEIRANHAIKTPDAIQWATAIQCGAKYFLTNDKGFKKLSDLEVLVLDDYLT